MSVAILDLRPAAAPGITSTAGHREELLRRLGLDGLPAHRRRLLCHWQPDPQGRLVCRWEPETVLASDDATSTTAR